MRRPDSVVFDGVEGTLRLDGDVVKVIERRVTTTAPVRAVDGVDLQYRGRRVIVRLQIAEHMPDGQPPKLTAYTMSSRNTTAAQAFHQVLTAAVDEARRSPDTSGEAAVRRVERPSPLSSPQARRIALAIAADVCLLVWAIAAGGEKATIRLLIVHLGVAFLVGAWLFVRPMVILRRRGITVRAEVIGYHHGQKHVRPKYRYVTGMWRVAVSGLPLRCQYGLPRDCQ